jgi:hypothetical protein
MGTSNVMEIALPFDPRSTEAEAQYDNVVRRINRVRVRRARMEQEQRELERQFCDADFGAPLGRRRKEPPSRITRRKQLMRLVELVAETRRLTEEERFALRALNRMDLALDRWVQGTYRAGRGAGILYRSRQGPCNRPEQNDE